MSTYATCCYEIAANSSRVCTENGGVIPKSKPNYFFYNVGKTEVFVEVFYGTAFSWIDSVGACTLKPGEHGIINTGTTRFFNTGQKVTNRGNRRALVYCSEVNQHITWYTEKVIPLKFDLKEVIKVVVELGLGSFDIPVVGSLFPPLLDFFWSDEKESAWDQVKDQLSNLLDATIKDTIHGILDGDLRYMKERLNVLKIELNDHISRETRDHYMNIAEDLVGFEKKFSFGMEDNSHYKDANYLLLPIYSAVVNLKVLFYQFGIVNQHKVKLSNDDIYSIKRYLQRLIEEPTEGAMAYINKVFKDQFNSEYEHCNSNVLYNSLATVRQFCAINGFEFFELWQGVIRDPFSTKKPYNSVISYSTIYGRPTPDLTKQMVPDVVAAPLQPTLVNGKRNRIRGLHIYTTIQGASKICGMDIHYANGQFIYLGTLSKKSVWVKFKGSYLKSLTVWGNGAVDMLEFEFTDGRREVCGSVSGLGEYHQKFQFDKHHIVGIFMSFDEPVLENRVAAGIAVSYQLMPQ